MEDLSTIIDLAKPLSACSKTTKLLSLHQSSLFVSFFSRQNHGHSFLFKSVLPTMWKPSLKSTLSQHITNSYLDLYIYSYAANVIFSHILFLDGAGLLSAESLIFLFSDHGRRAFPQTKTRLLFSSPIRSGPAKLRLIREGPFLPSLERALGIVFFISSRAVGPGK